MHFAADYKGVKWLSHVDFEEFRKGTGLDLLGRGAHTCETEARSVFIINFLGKVGFCF
jgi:hypothetical protein